MSDEEPKSAYDSRVQDVLGKLQFLSKIDKHEKLDVASLSLVADTWWTSFYRTIRKVAASQGIWWKSEESRKVSMEFIKTTTEEALKLVKDLFTRNTSGVQLNSSLGQMIICSLNDMNPGIEGLKKTYAGDKMFVSQIEAFQQVLKLQIQDLCRLWPALKAENFSKPSTSPESTPVPSEGSLSHSGSRRGEDKSSFHRYGFPDKVAEKEIDEL